jgi:hypothetical protein
VEDALPQAAVESARDAGEEQPLEHPQGRPRSRKGDCEPQEHPDRCSGERPHGALIVAAADELESSHDVPAAVLLTDLGLLSIGQV